MLWTAETVQSRQKVNPFPQANKDGYSLRASVHPETGDFQMLSDLAPGSVRSDARQIHFSGALANQISTN